MKKIFTLTVALMLMLTLAACDNPVPGGSDDDSASSEGSLLTVNEKAAVEVLWQELSGCWTAADERFAYFAYQDGEPAFIGGVWESEAAFRRGSGLVTGLTVRSDRECTITVCYPPVENGNAADEQETREKLYTFELDIGREGIDETIRLSDEDGVIRQYAWGGASYDDAYDSVHDVQYASFDEVSELWERLLGYWNTEDDSRFLAFEKDGGDLLFQDGVWEAGGGRGWGAFEKAMSPLSEAADMPTKLAIWYPAVGEENRIDGPLPELSQVIYLDLSDLDRGNLIKAQVGEAGDWSVYHYAGDSSEDILN